MATTITTFRILYDFICNKVIDFGCNENERRCSHSQSQYSWHLAHHWKQLAWNYTNQRLSAFSIEFSFDEHVILLIVCATATAYIYIYIFRTLKLAYRVNWTCYSNVIEKFCSIFCSLLLIVSSVLWIYFSILYSLYSCLVAACILRCPTSFPNINAHIDRVLNWDRGRLDEYWFRDFSQTCSCA